MGTTTTNLKLNVPVFDQEPWDEDVNDNWIILDAVVGQFSTLPNMVGVWRNATAYVYGQTTVDAADGSIWSCIQTNTSSAAPTTFAQERVSFPARWGAVAPGGQYWASQAANSAAAAAASAAAAAASAAIVAGALPLSGGTMTGFITLSADPTANLHAATKQYVDARVGGTGYLPLTGGTLTGQLIVGGTGIQYSNQGANANHISFGWNTTAITVLVNGTNIGNLATQGYVSGAYLPLAGGNVSGLINSSSEFHGTSFYVASSGAFFNSDATYTNLVFDTSSAKLRYTRSSGLLEYLNGSGARAFAIAANGNANIVGTLGVAGGVFAQGGVYTGNSAGLYSGPNNDTHIASDGVGITNWTVQGNYGWNFTWANGTLFWTRWDGTPTFQIRVSDGQAGCDSGSIYGNGGYINVSDESVKQNIMPAGEGLEHVLALEPIMFERMIFPGEVEIGFSAQQVQHVLPHAVRQSGEVLGVVSDAILVAVVNGMKTLNARLQMLEANDGTTTH